MKTKRAKPQHRVPANVLCPSVLDVTASCMSAHRCGTGISASARTKRAPGCIRPHKPPWFSRQNTLLPLHHSRLHHRHAHPALPETHLADISRLPSSVIPSPQSHLPVLPDEATCFHVGTPTKSLPTD